jgi:Group XII secretory phospholipase A2 precursor (PLA2G12)
MAKTITAAAAVLFYPLLLFLLGSRIVRGQAGGGGGGFDGFGGEAKFCPPFRCPKGQEPVPKWPLSLESTGCNGMGGMQVMSTGSGNNNDTDDPQAKCCDIRHACLQTCGAAKFFCDEAFTKCTADACTALADDVDAQKKCESSAQIHALMVKLEQSCHKYDAAQTSHCECVAKSGTKVTEKRERILRNFYKKYNPESIDKVAALAGKADSAAKFVNLLVKLYGKYPQVIKKIKDPQQDYMERIMRESKRKDKTKEDNNNNNNEEDDSSDAEDLGTEEL